MIFKDFDTAQAESIALVCFGVGMLLLLASISTLLFAASYRLASEPIQSKVDVRAER